MKSQINCIDIDGTICTIVDQEYASAEPFMDRIAIINNLYDDGHRIIYFTARGYITGIDWEEVTRKQFKKWGVRYHELKFGKPNADIYIDDKSKDPFSWFGS